MLGYGQGSKWVIEFDLEYLFIVRLGCWVWLARVESEVKDNEEVYAFWLQVICQEMWKQQTLVSRVLPIAPEPPVGILPAVKPPPTLGAYEESMQGELIKAVLCEQAAAKTCGAVR